MKKLLFIIAAISMSFMNITAQENDVEEEPIQTLFGGEDLHSSGFGGLEIKMTQLNNDMTILVGAKGGWTMNRTFTIGLAGFGTVYSPEVNYSSAELSLEGQTYNKEYDSKLRMGYGGLFLEYIHNSNAAIHFTANTIVGFGGMIFMDEDHDWYNDHNIEIEKQPAAAFFVVEPGLSVEFNILKFMRIGAIVSYRYMNQISTNSYYKRAKAALDAVKLNSFSAGLTFKFGSF